MKSDPASPSPAANGKPVLPLSELPPGSLREVRLDGRALLLVNRDGEIHALAAQCPHAGGALAQGRLQDGALVCPLHGARFNPADGSVLRGPARAGLECYAVTVEEGWIRVQV
jgi:3-phenylpropionate/trans-cinnamate dioxygenase ferredoxin subunit